MANILPKRVKDLPPFEPESEDELKTPAKNENHDVVVKQALDVFENIRIPRRTSELSPLSSESDDEDNKNDRLNCAILNDSFILSPTKSLECETPVAKCPENKAKSKLSPANRNLAISKDEEDSFAKDFQMLATDEKENRSCASLTVSSQPKSRLALFRSTNTAASTFSSQDNEFPKYNLQLFSQTKRSLDTQQNSVALKEEESLQPKSPLEYARGLNYIQSQSRKPYDSKKSPNAVIPNSTTLGSEDVAGEQPATIRKTHSDGLEQIPNKSLSKDLVTPYKSSEQNFVTPQVKSYQMPVSRRPNLLLSSNTTQKSRSIIENEFRSEKILFRTPIVMSRPPPVSSLFNGSINLSLDDTVKVNNVSETKISPVKEIAAASRKPSDEHLFMPSGSEKMMKASNEKVVLINGKEYVIEKKLGSGGSSSVFLAHRRDNQMDCALKIVDLRGDKAVVEGYLNETKLLAKLQGNVNVVSLYEYQHLPKECRLYMVMEKGDSDLNKLLQSYKKDLPLFAITSIWYQILQSVNYIHENGVIHSDLKPANFLMIRGRLKLIDFGIASNISIDSTSIIKFSQAGTFNYISPEALIDTSTGNSPAGKKQPKIKISTKSDVWSLGCILYLLLYKKTPFGHIKNFYVKVNAISNPATEIDYPKLVNYYPPIFIEMAKKCLQHNPKKRSSVADLLKYPFNMLIPMDREEFNFTY